MTNEHTSLEKYTSHTLFERVAEGLCVGGELETEQTATYWPQVPLSFAALLSHSAGLLNRGSWGPKPSAGSRFSLPRTAIRTSISTDSNSELFVAPGYIIVWHKPASCGVAIAPNSTRPQSRWYPDIFDRMHLLFSRVNLLFDCSAEVQYATIIIKEITIWGVRLPDVSGDVFAEFFYRENWVLQFVWLGPDARHKVFLMPPYRSWAALPP